MIRISVGDLVFMARLERERAPATVAALLRLLPLSGSLPQARWSGESACRPLGSLELALAPRMTPSVHHRRRGAADGAWAAEWCGRVLSQSVSRR